VAFNGVVAGLFATFAGLVVLIVPVMLWLERRSFWSAVLDTLEDLGSPLESSGGGEFHVRLVCVRMYYLALIPLLGPRLVWQAIGTWHEGQAAAEPEHPRAVASELLVQMIDTDEGWDPRDFVQPGRSLQQVWQALAYLRQRGWVSITRQRDRIWVPLPARRRLQKLIAR
jgi:hypothetical protein